MSTVLIFHIWFIMFRFTTGADLDQNSTSNYAPEQLPTKIINTNLTISSRQNGYGFIRFDGEAQDISGNKYGLITFDGPTSNANPLLKFNDADYATNPNVYQENGMAHVTFQDDNRIEGQSFNLNSNVYNGQAAAPNSNVNAGQKKRKRRRRRRPRVQQFPPQFGAPGGPGGLQPGLIGPYAPGYPAGMYAPGHFTPPFNRPAYRPRPPDTLTAVREALTSVARHDDRRCVARLLCEASAKGAPDNSALLSALGVLPQFLPLFTTSPLVVFGRGVFLGLSSKSDPHACISAFPDCPTDPEDLVHYLNNHNGGLFRFFSTPQLNQQNLQQLYNQLPGQHGLLPGQQNFPDPNIPPGYPQSYPGQLPGIPSGYPGQHYGFYQPNGVIPINAGINAGQQQYGLYPNAFNNPQFNNYGLNGPNFNGYPQNYSPNYNHRKYQFKHNDKEIGENGDENQIEKRIQNSPGTFVDDNIRNVNENVDEISQWHFPKDKEVGRNRIRISTTRGGKQLKFPEATSNTDRKHEEKRDAKAFIFPGAYTNRQYADISQAIRSGDADFMSNTNNFNSYFYNNYMGGFNIDESGYKTDSGGYIMDDGGVRTLYIVRGNGDPSHPEIVRLRPGEMLH